MTDREIPLILVVDDDQDTRTLIRRYLQDQYQVHTADSGEDALAQLKESTPQLILLDVFMPGMDGYEVCARLQNEDETAQIPVVFVSARTETPDKTRAFAAGAVDYVTKPIDKEVLRRKVAAHVHTGELWHRLQRPTSWTGRMGASDFAQFREFLSTQWRLSSAQLRRLSELDPARLYHTASTLGIERRSLAQSMASFLKLPYVARLNPRQLRLGVLPPRFCQTNNVVAINDEDGSPGFLLSNPFDWNLLNLLNQRSPGDTAPTLLITEPATIKSLCEASPSKDKTKGQHTPGPRRAYTIEGPGTEVRPVKSSTEEVSEKEIQKRPVQYIANNLLHAAVTERASDIHLEPKQEETIVRFRIDGDMHSMFTLKPRTGLMVISRLKALAGMDIAERRKPQDGNFTAEIGSRTFNLRLATTSTPQGESLIIRLLEPQAEPMSLSDLGMTEAHSHIMTDFASRTQGLILVVGPTGSGKTTTVYSLLHALDYSTRSLISVEDPVEYDIPSANQQQVNVKAGVTFDMLLKSSVRQDPDILYVGEVRDQYSARVCVDFASTGHLTITTLHTANATTAVFRLERLGITRPTMADVILGVVSQRLLKRLCPYCKQIRPITREEAKLLRPFTGEIPARVALPVGCEKCHETGYRGRVGIYEILRFDEEITEQVRSGTPIAAIRRFMQQRGDSLLADHALDKVREHVCSPRQVYQTILTDAAPAGPDTSTASTPVASAPTAATTIGVSTSTPTEVAEPPEASPSTESPASPTSAASILVVEDDSDTRALLVRLLDEAGYRTVEAQDGVDALLQLGKQTFDLVLADVNMPHLDGFALLEMKQEKRISTPFILLTARTDSEDEARGFELGAADFVRKPIKKSILFHRIQHVMNRNRGDPQ